MVDDALAVALVAAYQDACELLGPQRLQMVIVDLHLGEGAGDRLEERSLHIGQAAVGGNRGRNAPGDLDDLFGLALDAETLVRWRPS